MIISKQPKTPFTKQNFTKLTNIKPMQKLHLISLGCSKNLVDAEVMLGKLPQYQLTANIELADVIIVNTCGFIESAKQESVQHILHAIEMRKNGAKIVVSGCLSQRYADELKYELPEIDIITGVNDYDKIDKMLENKPFKKADSAFLATQNTKRKILNSSFHAYIKLSEGCNQQCSFCAIPSFKGKLQSRTLKSVLTELQMLYEKGFCDFSFIAQDSSSYLRDFGQNDGLTLLIKAIDRLKLRISCRIFYLYPSTTSMHLIETIAASQSFLPYFDMPLQHIADAMLRRMRRHLSAKQHIALLRYMREVPQSFVRTSFIIGHPGEYEREFLILQDFIQDFVFDRINLFAYSPQANTPAFNMKGHVLSKTTNERLNALNVIIKAQQKTHNKSLLGKESDIIIEGVSDISPYFYKARLNLWGPEIDGEILINDSDICDENGDIVPLKEGYYRGIITDSKQNFLFGKVLQYG